MKRTLILLLTFCIFSCNKEQISSNTAICDGNEHHIHLKKVNDSLTVLKPISEDTKSKMGWQLPYPIYHFEIADVDDDGCDEILVGVIKTTRFDVNEAKRLFIFKLFDGYIRPKWLGSRLSRPLVDFKTIQKDGTKIISLEKEENGNYLIAIYEYTNFGLAFVDYLDQNLNENEAVFHFYFKI